MVMAHARDRVRRRAKVIKHIRAKQKNNPEKRKNLKKQIAVVLVMLIGIILSAFFITKV